MGSMTLAQGTWKLENGKVELSQGSGSMGTSYRVDGNRLIPVIGGKDVTFWRFVRK
jgi:hypothetical protein